MTQYVFTEIQDGNTGVVFGVEEGVSAEDAFGKLLRKTLSDHLIEFTDEELDGQDRVRFRAKLFRGIYVEDGYELVVYPVDIDEYGDPINLRFDDFDFMEDTDESE